MREAIVAQVVKGTFDVKLVPQIEADGVGDPSLGRMSIDKLFHGDLDATSKGQMLAAQTENKTSGGYVALERVRGTLAGRRGSFVLQHFGLMTRGAPSLTVTIVPDSGTDELTGIAGSLTIDIVDKQHFYALAYTLPDDAKTA